MNYKSQGKQTALQVGELNSEGKELQIHWEEVISDP